MSTRVPAIIKKTPEMIMIFLFNVLSLVQLVHFEPRMETVNDSVAVMMEMTVIVRAASRSEDRASMESWTLHCICPVLCRTQSIQMPSHMTLHVTILDPVKVLIFHIGRTQVTMANIHPIRPTAIPPDMMSACGFLDPENQKAEKLRSKQ